jgi:hypothetical protein
MGEIMHTELWLESLHGRDRLEDLGIDERIILKWVSREIVWESVGCINFAEGRD